MPEKRKAAGSVDEEDLEKQSLESQAQARSIPDARFIAEVQSLLVGVDLTSMTLGELRSRLEEKFGLAAGTLASRKTLRRRIIFLVHQEVLKKSHRSSDCERIVQEILRLEDCPKTVRQMLIDSLHHSLSLQDAPGLHPHQVRQLELVRDALSDGRAKLELMRQARKEDLVLAQMELNGKETEVMAAQSEAAAAKELAEKAEAVAKETESEICEIEKDLTEHAEKAKLALEDTQKIKQRKEALVAVQKSLECMAKGLWKCEEEWWECFATLQQHMLDTGAESSLLTAATVSLKKRPSERSDFDAIAVEGVANFLCLQRSTADDELAHRPQVEMEAQADVLSSQSLLMGTQQRAKDEMQALLEAKAAQETSAASAAKAADGLPASKASLEEHQRKEADINARLQSLNEVLQQLADWISGSSIPGQCGTTIEAVESPLDAATSTMGAGEVMTLEVAATAQLANEEQLVMPSLKDVETKMLDLSPLRVPTPMKGRLSA